MAADPGSDVLLEQLRRLYEAGSAAVLRALAVAVRRYISNRSPDRDGIERAVARAATRVADSLDRRAAVLAADAVRRAARQGQQAAGADLRKAGADDEGLATGAEAWALTAAVAAMVAKLRSAHQEMAGSVPAQLRRILASIDGAGELPAVNRRQLAQRLLNRLAEAGVGEIRDRSGRRWDLASYAEMATRTQWVHTRMDAHLAQLSAYGIDLVVVSDHGGACPLCAPWEGEILDASGVAAAEAAGLFHPNCRHVVTAWIAGVTEVPTVIADPQGDIDRQRLRTLERQVRGWKRREAVALDPAAKAKALVKVRERQAAIRLHVATSTAKRQPHREQIGKAR